MKIISVYLNNFVNHKETTISADRVLNIFRGPHGAGKSSIRDAMELAFTGMCRTQSIGVKKDLPKLILHGASGLEVAVVFSHNGERYRITRKISSSTSTALFEKMVSTKEGPGEYVVATGLAEVQDAIEKTLAMPGALISTLFDAFSLVDLSATDRKKLLQTLFTTDSPETLMTYLVDQGHGDMPDKHTSMILHGYSTKGIEGAEAYAVEQRVTAKRDLKALKEPEEPKSVGITPEEAAALKPDIDKFQKQRDNLAGPVLGTIEEIKIIKAQIATSLKPTDPDPQSIVNAQNIMDGFQQDLESAEDALESLEGKLARTDTTRYSEALKAVEELGTKASKTTIAAIKVKISSGKPDPKVEDEVGKARQKVEGLGTSVETASRALTNVLEAKEAFDRWGQANGADLDALAKAEERVGEHTGQSIAAEIADLDAQLATLRERQSEAKVFEDYEARKQQAIASRGALHRKIENWDKVCKSLSPKNPKLLDLFSKGRDGFTEQFNSIAGRMLSQPITIREDFSIDGLDIPSMSEHYRIGIAMQIAACQQVGFETVIIDWGDILHGEAKKAFTNVLVALGQQGMNSMMFSTGDPDHREINGDVIIYAVEGGAVSS